jgi:multidrug efflux pump subunit AcrA (membrane-fusion protein)
MRMRLVLAITLLFALPGCTSIGGTPTALPTVVLGGPGATPLPGASGSAGDVRASAVVIPRQESTLAFQLAGVVSSVEVSVGDQVIAGQLLALLDNAEYQRAVDEAQRQLRELTSPAAIADAEQAVAAARKAADEAQKKTVSLTYPRASEALINNLKGQIELARKEVDKTASDYRKVENLADNDPVKATKLVAKTNAQLNYNQLVANYNWYKGKPSELDITAAQADLDAANSDLQEAQWYLAALRGDSLPDGASGPQLTALQEARDSLAAAQQTLDETRLPAPENATVVSVQISKGEYAVPGTPVIECADLSRLQVQTTDLSERDVPGVRAGQSVTVTVDALQQDVDGVVTSIAPLADTLGGDVVYHVTIELTTIPDGLRAGMSAEVAIHTGG